MGKGRSYWPSQWSVDYLLKAKEQDPIAFAFQYQQQPVATSDLVVSPELLVKGEIGTDECVEARLNVHLWGSGSSLYEEWVDVTVTHPWRQDCKKKSSEEDGTSSSVNWVEVEVTEIPEEWEGAE